MTEPPPWMRRPLPGSLPSGCPLPSLATSLGLRLPFLQPPAALRRAPEPQPVKSASQGVGNRFRNFGAHSQSREGEIPKGPWGEEGWEEEWSAERWRTLPFNGSFSSPPTPPKAPPPGTQVWLISRRCCWLSVVVVGSLVFFVIKIEKGKLVAPTNNPQAGRDKSSPFTTFGGWGSYFVVSACLARYPTKRAVYRPFGAPLLPHSPEVPVGSHLPG